MWEDVLTAAANQQQEKLQQEREGQFGELRTEKVFSSGDRVYFCSGISVECHGGLLLLLNRRAG